jgi:hypothetical protein
LKYSTSAEASSGFFTGPAYANQRLRLDVTAELDKLLHTDKAGIEAAPRFGGVWNAAIPAAQAFVPLENLESTAAKTNDAWFHGGKSFDDVRPPDAEYRRFIDEVDSVEPEHSGP